MERVDYLDMALIAGIGFPPFRGGLLRYADDCGIMTTRSRLMEMESKFGERFEPAGLLKSMETEGKTFYGSA